MKAENLGGTIQIEGSYLEIATLVTVLEQYVKDNPNDSLVKDMIHVIQNPIMKSV